MKALTSALIAVCICTVAISQDIHFSRFWMTPLLLNPAQAGAEHDMRGILNYKSQWNSVAAPYSTVNASWDMKIKSKKRKGFSAFGVDAFQDQAGDGEMKTMQMNLAYAYHIYLNKESTLGVGLYGGFAQRSINYSELKWMNQYDGSTYNAAIASDEPSGSSSLTYLDMGSGIHYEYGTGKIDLSVGAALFHANRPAYSFYGTDEKLNMKIVGYVYSLVGTNNRNIAFLPGVVYFQQGKSTELLAGTMFRYQFTGYESGASVALGAHYRNKDALIPTLMLEIAHYSIGISYDVNISGLKTVSRGQGGFEISLRYANPNPYRSKTSSRI